MKKIFLISGIILALVVWKLGILDSNKKSLNDFSIPVDQALFNNLNMVINK